MSAVSNAIDDEYEKRLAVVGAAIDLFKCYKVLNSTSGESILTIDFTLQKLDSYRKSITAIDVYNVEMWQQTCSTAQNSNLGEIFNHTSLYVLGNYNKIVAAENIKDVLNIDRNIPTFLGDNNYHDQKGSADFLFFIVTMLIIVDVMGSKVDLNTYCPGLKENVLNPYRSPIMHGVPLSPNFNVEAVGGNVSDFPYIKVNDYGEWSLLIPTIGYARGGDRCDRDEYKAKQYKNHDCSSSLVYWLGASHHFSTRHLVELHQFRCSSDEAPCGKTSKFEQMEQYLMPICSAELQGAKLYGAIFVVEYHDKTRHSGVLTGRLINDCIETLSYNRIFPFKEGLGYDSLCLNDFSAIYLFKEVSPSEGIIGSCGILEQLQ